MFKYDHSTKTYLCAFNKKHVCFLHTYYTINILLIYIILYIDNYIFENTNVNVFNVSFQTLENIMYII